MFFADFAALLLLKFLKLSAFEISNSQATPVRKRSDQRGLHQLQHPPLTERGGTVPLDPSCLLRHSFD